MKTTIAFLILAHEANDQLFRLTNALLSDGRSRVYIHMDNKVLDLGWTEHLGDKRLVMISDRVTVNWGGYSVVEATLRLLRRALADTTNEQFVLLSGSCFPLMPTNDLNDKILSLKQPLISIWGEIDPALRSGEGLGRYVVTKFHPHDHATLTPKASRNHERIWTLYKKLNSRLPYELHKNVVGLWKGSQFFIVQRAVAMRCAYSDNDLVTRLRYALAPDEIFFTTLIVQQMQARDQLIALTSADDQRQGSHFIIKRVPTGRRIVDRLIRQIDLRRLESSDIERALGSGALFARKCSAEISMAIADHWTSKEISIYRIF